MFIRAGNFGAVVRDGLLGSGTASSPACVREDHPPSACGRGDRLLLALRRWDRPLLGLRRGDLLPVGPRGGAPRPAGVASSTPTDIKKYNVLLMQGLGHTSQHTESHR